MKDDGLYTKKVMDHFKNPRNMGSVKNPDGIGRVGNVICGDVMHLYIKIGKNKNGEEIIKDVKYKTFGCVAAISTSSMVTELSKGKTIEQAMAITKDTISDNLGQLPKIKYHCSILAADALYEALYDYLSKNKKPIPKNLRTRHKKIEKEKKILEKRYEKWM